MDVVRDKMELGRTTLPRFVPNVKGWARMIGGAKTRYEPLKPNADCTQQ
jgi:hypothetical protein